MTDFVKAKFKYLATFEQFRWMPYLTTKHPIHENLIWVFISNATLEQVSELDEDPCRIVAINAFVMGRPIRITQGDVAASLICRIEAVVISMRDSIRACLFPTIMPQTFHWMRGCYTYLCLICSDPLGRSIPRYATRTTGSCTTSRPTTRSTCPP